MNAGTGALGFGHFITHTDAVGRTLLVILIAMSDMDRQLMHLRGTLGEHDAGVIGLTGLYHNLLRAWADM